MIKRYLLASIAVFILLSASRLFSYSLPAYKIEELKRAPVSDISRTMLLAREAKDFPKVLNFAGERIPLENKLVLEKMNHAFSEHFAQLEPNLALIRKRRLSMLTIDRILKRYDIPRDFRYLPLIESRLTLDTSHKGAGGYWQLMPSTARALGLVVNDEVDERNDLAKSTAAAAKYLKNLYQQMGSWTLAAAAYNAGEGTLLNALKAQGTGSYYLLDLSRETENYLYRLVAIKELLNHPSRYQGLYRAE